MLFTLFTEAKANSSQGEDAKPPVCGCSEDSGVAGKQRYNVLAVNHPVIFVTSLRTPSADSLFRQRAFRAMLLRKTCVELAEFVKGKPVVRRGRKATGLRMFRRQRGCQMDAQAQSNNVRSAVTRHS
jgi:hypothetical protein